MMPTSATLNIGAWGSELMATIFSDALHADEVLDRAGDADGDVELRGDGLSRLADLPLVGQQARLDDGPGTGDHAAKEVGEPLEHGHRFRVACPFSRNDEGGEPGDVDEARRRLP